MVICLLMMSKYSPQTDRLKLAIGCRGIVLTVVARLSRIQSMVSQARHTSGRRVGTAACCRCRLHPRERDIMERSLTPLIFLDRDAESKRCCIALGIVAVITQRECSRRDVDWTASIGLDIIIHSTHRHQSFGYSIQETI